MRNKDKLTVKQELFCNEYLIDLNATQAAIRAGYSPKVARQIGAKLLSKVYIFEKITELRKESMIALNITRNDILKTCWQIAQSKPDGVIVKTSDILKAIGKITDMLGFSEPEKKDPKHVRFYEDQASDKETKQIESDNQETGLSDLFLA